MADARDGGGVRVVLRWAMWLAVTGLVGRYAVRRAQGVLHANHDVGWFLHAGEVWLDGGRIGVDILDTNPPLIIWISAIEVLLGRKLEASPFVVHAVITVTLAVLCIGLAARGLRRIGVPLGALEVWVALALLANVMLTQYDFGQRDHWIALALLPYATWALLPREVSLLRAVIGVLAALAVALKPHFLLAALAVEVVAAVRQRSARHVLRVETVAATVACVAYGVSLLLFERDYFHDLRDTLSVYVAYDRGVPLLSYHSGWLLFALFAGAVCASRPVRSPVPLVFAMVATCGFLAAVLQRKNFTYHHVPGDLFTSWALALALGLSGAMLFDRRKVGWLGIPLVSAFCIWQLVALPVALQSPFHMIRLGQIAYFEKYAERRPVIVFSSSVDGLYPAVNFTKARSVSPYSCLWPIAGNYTEAERTAKPFAYRALAEMTPVERRMLAKMVDVMVETKPALIGFDKRPYKQAFGWTEFDFRTYFAADPRFEAAMQRYQHLATLRNFEYYRRRGR